MHHKGEIQLVGEGHLFGEDTALHSPRRVVVVVVEAAFPDGHQDRRPSPRQRRTDRAARGSRRPPRGDAHRRWRRPSVIGGEVHRRSRGRDVGADGDQCDHASRRGPRSTRSLHAEPPRRHRARDGSGCRPRDPRSPPAAHGATVSPGSPPRSSSRSAQPSTEHHRRSSRARRERSPRAPRRPRRRRWCCDHRRWQRPPRRRPTPARAVGHRSSGGGASTTTDTSGSTWSRLRSAGPPRRPTDAARPARTAAARAAPRTMERSDGRLPVAAGLTPTPDDLGELHVHSRRRRPGRPKPPSQTLSAGRLDLASTRTTRPPSTTTSAASPTARLRASGSERGAATTIRRGTPRSGTAVPAVARTWANCSRVGRAAPPCTADVRPDREARSVALQVVSGAGHPGDAGRRAPHPAATRPP